MTDDIFHLTDDRCSITAAANPVTTTVECIWPEAAVKWSGNCLNSQSNFSSRLLPSLLLTSKELFTGNLKVQTMAVATEVKKKVEKAGPSEKIKARKKRSTLQSSGRANGDWFKVGRAEAKKSVHMQLLQFQVVCFAHATEAPACVMGTFICRQRGCCIIYSKMILFSFLSCVCCHLLLCSATDLSLLQAWGYTQQCVVIKPFEGHAYFNYYLFYCQKLAHMRCSLAFHVGLK